MAVTPAPPPGCVTPEAGGRGADLRRRLVWGQGFGVGNRVAQAAAAPASLSGVPRHESGGSEAALPKRKGRDLLEEAGPGGARVAGVARRRHRRAPVARGLCGHRVGLSFARRTPGAGS